MSAVSANAQARAPALPPSYSDPFSDPRDATTPALPAYTPSRRPVHPHPAARQPEPKEFYYEVKRKGKPFAVMTVIAEGTLSKQMPTFLEGEPVRGRVQLSLDKPETIQSVVVNVHGQIIAGANPGEQLTFIDIAHTLWSQGMGDPRNTPSAASGSSSRHSEVGNPLPTSPVRSGSADSNSNAPGPPSTPAPSPGVVAAPTPPKSSGKLYGEYTWTFAIDMPKEVVLPYGARNERQVFTPPQTFNERHTRASIRYEVSVRLVRNKLLRADHRIPAQFGYIPITRPPPFPPLRCLAYQEGTALIGPTIDPEGWHALEPIRIKGKIFNNRVVDVGCTLSYTRGSVIPLCMKLQSDDTQALDLLSSPKGIVVRLRRRIKYHVNAEKTLESLAWRDSIDHSQLAVWWPSAEGSEEGSGQGRRRFVNGELHLRSDVKPTSAMAHFRIEYSIVLFPFDMVGFEAVDGNEYLLEHPVDVVTAYAAGPRPRMTAPPGYESEAHAQAAPNTFLLTDMDFF